MLPSSHAAAIPAPHAIPRDRTRLTAPSPALVPALAPPIARRVLGEAALLGLTGDALLRDSLLGIALPLWVALVAATFISIAWSERQQLARETVGWLIVAILAAATVAWRDAALLQFAGLVTTLGALAMAALTCRDGRSGLRAERLRDTLWAVSGVVRSVAAGLVPLALHESFARGDTRRAGHRIEPMLRASVMTAALVLVFGSLLRSADPLFASLFSLPALDVGTVLSHAILMALFCWLTGGWIRAALDTREPTASPAGVGVRLGVLEVTAALGALNLLFTAYLLTQLGWYFGGERFLRERTGLTAAAYARDGFFQIACVMLLVIPVLMATRAMLPDDRALRRRHSRLALPLIGLLGLMLLSAASRMLLYVHYFGLTTDRVYPMVVMTWLGVVLGWFGWTELRGNGARFVSGTIVSGLLVLATMNVMSPDVLVARIDIARASGTGSDARRHLDREYLASLSGDAVPLVVQATLAPVRSGARGAARVESERQRCRAAVRLLEDWGAGSSAASSRRWESAWRTWNAGQARGLRAVRDGAPALRALAQRGCPDSAMAPRPPSTQR